MLLAYAIAALSAGALLALTFPVRAWAVECRECGHTVYVVDRAMEEAARHTRLFGHTVTIRAARGLWERSPDSEVHQAKNLLALADAAIAEV